MTRHFPSPLNTTKTAQFHSLLPILFTFLLLCLIPHLTLSTPISLTPFLGKWPFQSFRHSNVNSYLFLCEDTYQTVSGNETASFQARYTENGVTIGFLYSDNLHNNDSDPSLLSSQQLMASGQWFEAGQHSGQFEMKILDATASPPTAQFTIWYQDEKDESSVERRYKYYTSQFESQREVLGSSLDASNDCWVSNTSATSANVTNSNGTTVSTAAFYEGQWTQGTDPVSDSFYMCHYNNSIGGQMFGGLGYWHGETSRGHSVISGRWETSTKSGSMILKYVDDALVGTFLVGLSNMQSQTQYVLNPNGTPAKLTRNQTFSPEGSQCIDMDLGFSGTWTESLHGQSLSLCAKKDGTLYGAYTRQVQVNDVATVMPVGVIRGKVDESSKKATGTWYEAGQNQRGSFEWSLDSSTASKFTGTFWSADSIVDGITTQGMEWSERRLTWAASPGDCLEPIYLLSNDSIEGFWSMPDFPDQKHPSTGAVFTDLELTVCKDSQEQSTNGIYHNKGDWQGNDTVGFSIALGYFKEHWKPVGVKIAGNVLFRMRHDNFSVAYHFEGENNDISTLGHMRSHSKLRDDLASRNCTVVFPSSGMRIQAQHSMLWILAIVVSLVMATL